MTNNRKPVLGILVAALVLVAGTVQADFESAMNYFKANKYLEAAGEFQALVDESPEYADGYFMLGICFMKTAKPAQAETNFLKAIELNPDKFEYHYNLANSYQVRGKYPKVVSILNTAEGLAQGPLKINVYKLRGFAYAAQKKWEPAIEDLEKAEAIQSDPASLTQLGKAYFSLGEYATAVVKLRAALQVKPNNPESHELMAEALLNLAAKATSEAEKRKRYSEALAEAEKFLELKRTSTDAGYLVGRAALGAREYDKAVAAFTKVLAAKPNHCNAMANQGKAFTAKKDWDNALAALDNATTCSPGMALAWENKGFVLQRQATAAKSVELYNNAIAAYQKANSIKSSGSIEAAIATCRQNINVIDHNVKVAQLEKEQDEAARQAQADYEEAKRKEEEWKQKQEDD